MPGLMAVLSRWAPKAERARMGSIVFGGAQIGNIAGTYLSGLIMHTGDWDDVFYLFGALGLIWFVLWVSFIYNILLKLIIPEYMRLVKYIISLCLRQVLVFFTASFSLVDACQLYFLDCLNFTCHSLGYNYNPYA